MAELRGNYPQRREETMRVSRRGFVAGNYNGWILMSIIKKVIKSSIGKKYLMACTGCLFFGFVIVHLVGNLQIFLGPDAINAYAQMLQSNRLVLWGFRLGMMVLAATHVTTATLLYFENRNARPVPYVNYTPPSASYASRTMVMSGLILLAFIIFHLLHFTVGAAQPQIMHHMDAKLRHDVYRMVIEGFSHPAISIFYIVGMGLLYLHLSHGISSFFQSLGLKNAQLSGLITGFSQGAALLIFIGNCAIPIAVLTKIIS
jgi:succinate dehydrogenase / fumarate reductase cytochrome b subunit